MGEIRIPPRDVKYPYPKAVGQGHSIGKIIGRAMVIERFSKWGDYMRIVDLVEFQPDEHQKRHKELRFCQFYRRFRGTYNDWIFGQGAGHMSIGTFYKLVHKAMTRPDYGTFGSAFKNLSIKKIRRQRKN
ncbi:MAG: hypothetical protein HYW65_03695 [Candidatus Liptonbacteria bacterium]|nr:hypothetical protein [Candidatus Liptonbacteria bacterium]MBI3114566.1 hypothetical protein [Candidatus Harrisonbacteria bacterium]